MSNDHAQAGGPQATGKAPDPGTAIPSIRLWGLALAAGVAAGFVSWYAGEALHGHFKPALAGVNLMGTVTQRPTAETEAAADVQNAGLVFAILGASLGVALGLAGGLVRGNPQAALGASIGGLVLGAGVGFLAARCAVPIYHRMFDPLSQSLTVPLLNHGAIWSAVGAAGGLAFGVGLGGRSTMIRGALGGLVGGLLGTVVYELAGATLFPLDRTIQPISLSSSSRMLARFCVALLVAAGAAFAVQSASGDRQTQVPATPNPPPTDPVP